MKEIALRVGANTSVYKPNSLLETRFEVENFGWRVLFLINNAASFFWYPY